ncbi:MAG: hypothetical protein Q8906_05045 [Bacillota bacterium]|nr:hypothetical protein [Bacillota bacterium]
MLKKLFALFVVVAFLANFEVKPASADEKFRPEQFPYKAMQIQVMPEFDYPPKWPKDKPSLLVGQYGTMVNKSGKDFSGKIEIQVPAKEKNYQLSLVAEFPSENKPEVPRPYALDTKNGTVSWTPQKPIKNNETYRFVIEYYSNSINVKDRKSFSYSFTNQANIDLLDVIYYAPLNAKEIKLEPKPLSTSKSEYGEDIYYYQYKNLKKGNKVTYNFSYKKDGNESTLTAIDKKQPPKDANHTGVNGDGTATDQVLKNGSGTPDVSRPIIGTSGALIIGLSIIIAGAFVFFGLKGNKKAPPKTQVTQKKSPKKQTARRDHKLSNVEEKKELRKKLLNGKIDQETYEEERKKLI